MNGIKDASNFLDVLLVEYQFNQAVLTQKNEKRPPPVNNDGEQRLIKLFKGSVGQRDRELHTKLFQSAQNRELSFALPRSHQQLLRLERLSAEIGFFDRELGDEVTRKMAPVLSAFEQRVGVAFTTFEDYQHRLVMGELLLQALMRSQPGLHLLIVSQEYKETLSDHMSMVYWRGAQTVFQLLVKDPSLHDFLISRVLELLLSAMHWKLPYHCKNDYDSIQGLLSLLALIPAQKLRENFHRAKKLGNQDSLFKMKTAVTHHLRYGVATRVRAELVAKFDEVLAFLGSEKQLSSHFSGLRNYINSGIDDPTQHIGHVLQECAKTLHAMHDANVYCAYYLLAAKICSINPHKIFSENNREYPSSENLLTFVKNMPHQIRGGELGASSKIIITTAEGLEYKSSQELQQLFSTPVRSLFYQGHNVTFTNEWKLLCKWKSRIEAEIKQRYPQEPIPFCATFTERITEL